MKDMKNLKCWKDISEIAHNIGVLLVGIASIIALYNAKEAVVIVREQLIKINEFEAILKQIPYSKEYKGNDTSGMVSPKNFPMKMPNMLEYKLEKMEKSEDKED